MKVLLFGDCTRVACDMTLAGARALLAANLRMLFVHVPGAGAEGGETSESRETRAMMWERVLESAAIGPPGRNGTAP